MRTITSYLLVIAMLLVSQLTAQWTEQESGYEIPWILFDNSFPPGQNNVGFIGGMYTTYNGDGIILKTEDGGQNWELNLGGPDGSIDGIEAIFFSSLDVGYAAGWNSDILYTEDGGDTWSEMSVGTNIWYYTDIEFWDEDNGVISAKLNSGSSQVWVTDDAGETWTAATGVSIDVIDLTYSSANTLFAVGSSEDIIKSTDGGSSWTLNHDGSDPDNDPLLGVHFYNASFGVAGGMDGKIKITTNGGSSWSTSQIAGNYPSFYAVHCFNTDSIYVGGTDNIIYKSTDGGDSWVSDNGGGSGTLYQFAVTANKTSYVTGASAVILVKEGPMSVDFTADETEICTGTTVNFTDNSSQAETWEWTFEGGNPSTSTEQNPSVTYENPGTFDVKLTITNGDAEMTELKTDYINVLDVPEQANIPEGEEEVCTGNFYTYAVDEVDYATDYEWELLPEDAGILTWDLYEAQLETATDWTGDSTLRARASNACGTGDWSDSFEGSVVSSPEDYNVEGGGTYCLDDEGVEIALSGSDTGVEYELYYDGDPTGITVEGTGSAISFGLQTEEGYYTVVADNGNCEQAMTGQVQVIVEYPPMEPGTPEGPQIICSEESTDYETSGTDDADTYAWILDPEEAGTITFDGLEATVVWNTEFTGLAYISVYGINACGDGNPSEELEVAVEGTPAPEISGETLVCDLSTETYETEDNDGSTYTWEVTGGDITDGQGTAVITVSWGSAGSGLVALTEETAGGCTGNALSMEVTIDDCTGLGEAPGRPEVKLFPNPAGRHLNLELSVDGETVVRIYNTLGKVVHEEKFTTSKGRQVMTMDIGGFEKGLYVVQVNSASRMIWQGKFIRE